MRYRLEDYPFTIADVVRLMGIRVRRRNPRNWDCDCPFCNFKQAKMNVNLEKNVYRCNYCGEQGGMLALYGHFYNLSNREAYDEICSSLHLGTEAPEYQENKKEIPKEEPEFENAGLAPVEQISRTYFKMLSLLTLSEKHQQDLLKRGLTIEQIEKQKYRSTPVFGVKQLAKRLVEGGYAVKGVPGFYQEKDGNWNIHFTARASGILIPYVSMEGYIQGMQIRLDHPRDGQKYIWLSSVNQNMGVSSGSPIHFIGDPDAELVYITEGGLKGTVSHYLDGNTYLCNAGVSQYKNLAPALSKLKNRNLKGTREAYDMDKLMSVLIKPQECTDCKHRQNCQAYLNYLKMDASVKESLWEMTCPRKEKKRQTIQQGCTHLYDICKDMDITCERMVWDIGTDGIWKGQIKGIDDYWYEQNRES